MQAQLDLLKLVKENKSLCNEFEAFMKELAQEVRKSKKQFEGHYSSRRSYFEKAYGKLGSKIDELSKSYGTPKEALILFYSMDKRLGKLLWNEADEKLETYLTLKGDRFGYLEGSTFAGYELEEQYSWGRCDSITEFLSEIMDILPSSSRNYIKSKTPTKTEAWNSEKITNEFSRKVFFRELADKPESARLRALVQKFYNIEDSGDRLLTFHNFYTAIDEKYSGKNERGSKMIKDEVISSYYRYFKIALYSYSRTSNSKNTIESLKKLLSKDISTLKRLVELCIEENVDTYILFFLYECNKNKEISDLVKNRVFENIATNSHELSNILSFSDSLKDALFLEIENKYKQNISS